VACGIEGEGKVDDADVDLVGVEDSLGGARGVGDVGLDAHGFEHFGEAIDPWVWLPAGS